MPGFQIVQKPSAQESYLEKWPYFSQRIYFWAWSRKTQAETPRTQTCKVKISYFTLIPEIYKKIALTIDILFVNTIPLLNTKTKIVQFGSAQAFLIKHNIRSAMLCRKIFT